MPTKRTSKAYRYSKIIKDMLNNGRTIICPICGRRIYKNDELSIDHTIPLSKGGEDKIKNMKAAHLSCNLKKGDNL